MRIFWLRGLAVLGICTAAGCQAGLPGGAAPVTQINLSGGAVVVRGPEGYCVDRRTSRPGEGLAIMAACATLAGSGDLPWPNAVILVQAGEAGSAAVTGAEEDLRALLSSPEGRLLLSSGNGDTIDIRTTTSSAGLVNVIFTDASPTRIPGTQQAEWRAFVDVGDRLVTISLRGLTTDPLAENIGAGLLGSAVAALRQANAS